MNCVFCNIVEGKIPSHTIFEDEIVKVIMDVNPRSNGHLLVIPNNHYQDFYDIDNEVLSHIFDIAKKMCVLLTKKLGCDGITLEENNGISQEVKHFHLHIIPKYSNKINMEIEEVFHKLVD